MSDTSNISNDPNDGHEHRFGQLYDERRGVGNGPQLCLLCHITLKQLLQQECDRARIDELAKLIPHTERWPWKADPRIKGLTVRDWIPIEVINTRLAELQDLNQGGEADG